jgi:hypothetical protein
MPMKILSIFCVASVILLLLATSHRAGNQGELPGEIAANLKVVPNTDLLISMPPFETKQPTVVAASKPCSTVQFSYVQVIYPITICYPPYFPTIGILKEYALAPGQAPLPPPAGQTQTYTLSSFKGEALTTPLFCLQKGGPWLASIIRFDPCSGPTKFVLTILGVPACPECPTFSWYDDLDNHPPELNLIMPLVNTTTSYISCDPTNPTLCGAVTNPTPPPPPAPLSGK